MPGRGLCEGSRGGGAICLASRSSSKRCCSCCARSFDDLRNIVLPPSVDTFLVLDREAARSWAAACCAWAILVAGAGMLGTGGTSSPEALY